MFDVLLSSMPSRHSGPARAVASMVLHGVVVVGAIRVTTQAPIDVRPPEAVSAVYLAPPTPVEISPAAPPSGAPVVSAPAAMLPPAPIEVPSGIPPVTLGPALDPALLRRAMTSGPPGPATGTRSEHPGGFTEAEVDEAARVVSQPFPRYPPALQQAQVEGRVLVEFVIDTTGHLEEGSLRIVESSNRGFEATASLTVLRSLFRPARLRGQAVRQRTTQAIAFRIR